ncbi:alpha/beta fold hydrolase [Saccharospirillum impatiens]|uniref:alpha/beta fold hydrolase n=1 Tax=Saccharospirillum impatiens TaxID=169438 RepID=UPI00040C051C|nr:alpha/beta hydrolase [Saccharospirillum impatiens]
MRSITLLGGQVQGVVMGQGRPVLALHGFLDNAFSFKPLSGVMPDVEIWALDLPGHGASAPLAMSDGWSITQWLPVMGRLLDELDWGHYTLLGHSLGAILAQMLAAVDPRIERLICLDALGPLTDTDDGNLDRLQRSYQQRQHRLSGRRFYPTPEALWQVRVGGRFPLSEDSARVLSTRGVGLSDRGWYHRYDRRLRQDSAWRMTEKQVQALLGRIECPLDLALFEDSPLGRAGSTLDNRLACLSNLSVAHFPGGHHAHMETPEPLAQWVSSRLDADLSDPGNSPSGAQ